MVRWPRNWTGFCLWEIAVVAAAAGAESANFSVATECKLPIGLIRDGEGHTT